MKVAIVGSREYPYLKAVSEYVKDLALKHPDVEIVSGGARGVDQTAEETARELGLKVHSFRAEWDIHGRAAGFMRNEYIVARADRVVAFWDGTSRGTEHTIKLTRKAGKPCEVITPRMRFTA